MKTKLKYFYRKYEDSKRVYVDGYDDTFRSMSIGNIIKYLENNIKEGDIESGVVVYAYGEPIATFHLTEETYLDSIQNNTEEEDFETNCKMVMSLFTLVTMIDQGFITYDQLKD